MDDKVRDHVLALEFEGPGLEKAKRVWDALLPIVEEMETGNEVADGQEIIPFVKAVTGWLVDRKRSARAMKKRK